MVTGNVRVTSIVPRYGSRNGATRLTIYGSGTWFKRLTIYGSGTCFKRLTIYGSGTRFKRLTISMDQVRVLSVSLSDTPGNCRSIKGNILQIKITVKCISINKILSWPECKTIRYK